MGIAPPAGATRSMWSTPLPRSQRLPAALAFVRAPSPSRHVLGLFLIAGVCGLIDAACYLSFGGVFAEMMTGNLLLLSLDIGRGARLLGHLVYILAILAFAGGAVVGSRIVRGRRGDGRFGFVVEWCILAVALLVTLLLAPAPDGGARDVVVALLAFAMGIQNALIRRHGVPDIATNVMTLTLAALVAETPLAGGRNERLARRAGSVGAFAASGIAGAALSTFVGPWAPLAAAVAMFSLSLLCLTGDHGGARP
jgi:uncharacterized membrane protein YoaK (UPF0700 family)